MKLTPENLNTVAAKPDPARKCECGGTGWVWIKKPVSLPYGLMTWAKVPVRCTARGCAKGER